MVLKNKNAVVYGAAGSLGGAVAKALAAAGARVFLTGRRLEPVQKLAEEIRSAGGTAEAAQVDGFNEKQIGDHLEKMIANAGSIDITFNAVDIPLKQNVPLITLSLEEFVEPVTRTMQTRFLAAVAAAKIMVKQRSGVILSLTATPAGIGYP